MVDGTHHKSKNVTAEPERPGSVPIWIYPIETPHTAYIKTHSAQKTHPLQNNNSTQHTAHRTPTTSSTSFHEAPSKKTWTKHRRFKTASLASDSRKPYFFHQLSCVIPFLIVLQSSDILSSRHQNTSPPKLLHRLNLRSQLHHLPSRTHRQHPNPNHSSKHLPPLIQRHNHLASN